MTPNTIYFVEVQLAPDQWYPALMVQDSTYAIDNSIWTAFANKSVAQAFATAVSQALPGHTVRVGRRVARGNKKRGQSQVG